MESYFWFGDDLENFLFKGLTTKSWSGLLGICVALASVALLYEALHVLKRFFLNRFLKARKALQSNDDNQRPSASSSAAPRSFIRRRNQANEEGSGEPAPRSLLEESDEVTIRDVSTTITCSKGFVDLGISSFLHGVYMFLGFTLMNAVMTFNVWVLLGISLGVGGGYFLFGNYRREDNLIQPLNIPKNARLLTSDSIPVSSNNGGGDSNGTSSTAYLRQSKPQEEGDDDAGESSRLIVGAQVHAISTSASPS